MEAAPVYSLADAMFRLPAKLDRLLTSHGHTLPRGAQDEIPLIKQDLEKMIVFLQGHDDSGAEYCGMMVNCLAKEVRELSYDMEDSVDQYEHAAGTRRWILYPRRKKYKITRRSCKITTRIPEKLKWRLWMANKIREFSMRSREALQRGLPALTVLSLYVRTKRAKRIVFNKTGFSVLKYFKFRCRVPWLKFEADAMLNLRKLKICFDVHGADQHGTIPVGIVHLSGLEEISAKIGGAGANDPDRRAAESALIYAIKMHPARPTFNIQCLDGMFSGEDDYNSEVQEEEYMTLQEQYDISEEDSMDQHVLQKGTWEGAHSRFSAFSAWKTVADKQPDSRNEMPKWSMQVRVGTFQDVNGADDGFNWTKYGQKDILGSKYPREADPSSHRGYYECKHSDTQGCKAEKQLQRTDDDPLLFDVRYINSHTCVQRANSQPQPGHEKSSVSGGVKAKGSMQRLEKMPPR
ncbi:hypothetical protein ACQ4PT_019508 [Festuca glaucescens]